VDGEPIEYQETSTTVAERTLKFPIPDDAFEIEIFGSQVVPELPIGLIVIFGSVISLVLVFHRIRFLPFLL
jgi:hypothetical protein